MLASRFKHLVWILALSCYATVALGAEPLEVALSELIAHPKKYQNRTVRVVGFLHLEFEGNALYLRREALDPPRYENAIWVDVTGLPFKTASAHNDSYVAIVGTFSATDRGHLGLWSGSIARIERIDAWKGSIPPQLMTVPGSSAH